MSKEHIFINYDRFAKHLFNTKLIKSFTLENERSNPANDGVYYDLFSEKFYGTVEALFNPLAQQYFYRLVDIEYCDSKITKE